MKTLRRPATCAVAAVLCSLALATTATAAAETPLRAILSGSVSETNCGVLTICLSGTQHGIATLLGRATLTKTATVHITFTPCAGGILTTYSESGTLTAANGDTLTLSGSGTACAAHGRALGTGTLTVTDGSGRFAGATGSLAETIDHDLVTDEETVSLNGAISRSGGPSDQ